LSAQEENMSRLILPALGAALLALAACGAATESGSTSPSRAAESTAPTAPASDGMSAELRTVTLSVAGMG
jgi:hypothetical protein